MKTYEIILDEIAAEFFEEIALIVQRPVEAILSDALFKQVELFMRKAEESTAFVDNKIKRKGTHNETGQTGRRPL